MSRSTCFSRSCVCVSSRCSRARKKRASLSRSKCASAFSFSVFMTCFSFVYLWRRNCRSSPVNSSDSRSARKKLKRSPPTPLTLRPTRQSSATAFSSALSVGYQWASSFAHRSRSFDECIFMYEYLTLHPVVRAGALSDVYVCWQCVRSRVPAGVSMGAARRRAELEFRRLLTLAAASSASSPLDLAPLIRFCRTPMTAWHRRRAALLCSLLRRKQHWSISTSIRLHRNITICLVLHHENDGTRLKLITTQYQSSHSSDSLFSLRALFRRFLIPIRS